MMKTGLGARLIVACMLLAVVGSCDARADDDDAGSVGYLQKQCRVGLQFNERLAVRSVRDRDLPDIGPTMYCIGWIDAMRGSTRTLGGVCHPSQSNGDMVRAFLRWIEDNKISASEDAVEVFTTFLTAKYPCEAKR